MLSQHDQQIMKRLLSRDEKALRSFYALHKTQLYTYLLRSQPPEDAEEVLQDAFVAFIESLRNFQGKSSLKTFLYSIAKRKSIDKHRRQRLKRLLFSYVPEYIVETFARVFMMDTLDSKHLAHRIEKVMDELPHDYARILRLKYIEDYSVGDIAEEISLSSKATESLLFRARKAFIKVYSDHERRNLHPFEEAI